MPEADGFDFDDILTNIDNEIELVTNQILGGPVTTIEDYRNLQGQMRGLRGARAVVERALNRYERDNKD